MCDATFCSSTDYSRECTQSCYPIVRRSVRMNDEPAMNNDVTTSYDLNGIAEATAGIIEATEGND